MGETNFFEGNSLTGTGWTALGTMVSVFSFAGWLVSWYKQTKAWEPAIDLRWDEAYGPTQEGLEVYNLLGASLVCANKSLTDTITITSVRLKKPAAFIERTADSLDTQRNARQKTISEEPTSWTGKETLQPRASRGPFSRKDLRFSVFFPYGTPVEKAMRTPLVIEFTGPNGKSGKRTVENHT